MTQTSVYLASRNPDELNILSKPHLLELMDLWEIITGMEIEYEGHMYRWDDVCMRSTPLLKDKLLPCKVSYLPGSCMEWYLQTGGVS